MLVSWCHGATGEPGRGGLHLEEPDSRSAGVCPAPARYLFPRCHCQGALQPGGPRCSDGACMPERDRHRKQQRCFPHRASGSGCQVERGRPSAPHQCTPGRPVSVATPVLAAVVHPARVVAVSPEDVWVVRLGSCPAPGVTSFNGGISEVLLHYHGKGGTSSRPIWPMHASLTWRCVFPLKGGRLGSWLWAAATERWIGSPMKRVSAPIQVAPCLICLHVIDYLYVDMRTLLWTCER